MSQFKKSFFLILLTIYSLTICCCTIDKKPHHSTEKNELDLPEVSEPVSAEPTQLDLLNAVFDEYEYRHEDERDLDWEKDIVYFAQLFLGEKAIKGHPYLVDAEVQFKNATNSITFANFLDTGKRETFIQEILTLIEEIPERSDVQITYELQRIVSGLGDCHSKLYFPKGKYFPLEVESFSQDGALGLYVTSLPAEYGDLLYAKLVSVNGTPVEAIIEELMPYVICENEHRGHAAITSSVCGESLITNRDALSIANVLDESDVTARFGLLTEQEETVEIELVAYSKSEIAALDLVENGSDFLCYAMSGNEYFFTYLQEEDALYIRFYSVPQQTSAGKSFLDQIRKYVEERGGVSRTIIDFRDNSGGNYESIMDLIDYLKEPETGPKFALVNEGTASAAVLSAYKLDESVEDSLIIGTYTAQAPNTFGNPTTYSMRTHNISFAIPTYYVEFAPEYDQNSLIPDILVYPLLSDYKDGSDTILETALKLKDTKG